MPRLYSSRNMSLSSHDGVLALESASASAPAVPGSEGPLYPGTGADDAAVGTAAWTNPGRIVADDSSRATIAALAPTATSHYLKGTNFGFAVPVGATITGVTVEIERHDANETEALTDTTVRLVKGGTVSGDNKASGEAWPGFAAVQIYGGASDLWGLALSAADVNAADFGVVLSAASGVFESNPNVDFFRITVHYTT